MTFDAALAPASTDGRRAGRTVLDTLDWRQRVFGLYARVREAAESSPARAHELWIAERDALFATHPATPLLPQDRAAFTGLPVTPYDPAWRFEVELTPAAQPRRWDVETGTDGVVPFELLGAAVVPGVGSLDVWRLASYGGGLFVPVKDRLAGSPGGTYGGGRYLLDTIKGAWLGERDGTPTTGTVDPTRPNAGGDAGSSAAESRAAGPLSLVLDFNFAYNPSCAYDPAWACPLAPAGNTLAVEVPVGERYAG